MVLDADDKEIEDNLKECTFSLTIPRCEEVNGGKYTIKAKNKWGECESSAQLTIVFKPEIEGPEDVAAVPGDAAEFEIKVHACPEPEITWIKDGQVIRPDFAFEVLEDTPNEIYKLIIKKVEVNDAGHYEVVAKNEYGESNSRTRLKTIKEPEPTTEKPQFITGLADAQVEDGGEIVLKVRADGLPRPEISWFFNGKPVAEDLNHKIDTIAKTQVTSSLVIQGYNLDDIGQYKAMAVNCAGEAETTARISMTQTPPGFGIRMERSLDVSEGEPLEIKAKITGSPKPTVSNYYMIISKD
ncbi:obscurin-like, partial [Agrilus planipennis]|uniref:Obscurin-like n=1 Tax=Agrilus planipennis TaxID=224129 RepID=A0A7F5RGJ1_AGRPL